MIIGLCGPNAIGKTTALRRWCDHYPKLYGAFADVQLETVGRVDTRVREWKGTVEDKAKLVQQHRETGHILVVDSARTMALEALHKTDQIILVLCTGPTMGRNIKARCEEKGKKYREDYWTKTKLEYEASKRYRNWVWSKAKCDYKVFWVEEYERDWPPIDEYFASLYRRAHNQKLREGRLLDGVL